MKKILNFLLTNPITYSIGMLIVYIFYGAVLGISMAPSVLLVYKVFTLLSFSSYWDFIIITIVTGISTYLFFIVALLVFGIVERN